MHQENKMLYFQKHKQMIIYSLFHFSVRYSRHNIGCGETNVISYFP